MKSTIRNLVHYLEERCSLLHHLLRKYRVYKAYRGLGDRSEIVPSPFGVFNIELTNNCPMRCVMCPRTNHMTRELGFMEFGLFQKIICEFIEANAEKAVDYDIWLHNFGESLLHPEFGKFIRYATSKGISVCLSLNPIMLTPKVARELLDGEPRRLYISLDGSDDDSFQKIRGVKNSYERSKKNLEEFLNLKTSMNSKTRVALSMIDFPMNKVNIAKQKKHWKTMPGVDEFLQKGFLRWDGNADDINELSPRKRDNAELRKKRKMVLCSIPWRTVTITWDGDVVPCCMDYNKRLVLGNVRNEKLSDIWNGERIRMLRRELLSNDVKNPLCRNCDILYGGTYE